MHVQQCVPYYKRIYNRLPEGEPSVSKHVEDIKIKIEILIQKMCILVVCVV
jgi:hypothetical protein